jgi:uncharacterized protein YjdB
MKSNLKTRMLSFAAAALVTMTCSTQLAVTKAHAASISQELLITEVLPMSQTSDDFYEYIEIYNNSDKNIDIKDYKLTLQNIDITTSKTISPKGTLVICTNGSTTLEAFNLFYGSALTKDRYMNLPFVSEILSNTSSGSIILAKDDATVVSRAQYNTGDFSAKKSISFKYSQSGFDMILLSQNQTPTPGNINSEQIPQSGLRVTGVTLDKSVLTMEANQTSVLYATIAPATALNKSVVWSSDSTEVVQVNQNGVLTAKTTGIATVTATTVDGGFSASCIVVVTRVPVIGITLDKSTASVDVGKAIVLTASITPADATNKLVNWRSSNTNIASVDSNGVVIGRYAGEVVITAETADGKHTATCRVKVNAVNTVVPVTGISIAKQNIIIKKGNAVALEAQVLPLNATNKKITWRSSDSNIASVDAAQGIVIAKQSGVVVISAVTDDGGKTAYCYVTVTNDTSSTIPVTSVELSTNVILMNKGENESLTASVKPANATNKAIEWSTSDSSVASIDNSGKVTALKQGFAIITVKTAENGLKDRCFIVVRDEQNIFDKITSFRLNKISIRIEEGKFEKLNVITNPGYMKSSGLVWTSSDEKIATVSNDGRVYAKGEGSATITVSSPDGKYKASCEVDVTDDKGHGNGNGKGKAKGHSKWWDWED